MATALAIRDSMDFLPPSPAPGSSCVCMTCPIHQDLLTQWEHLTKRCSQWVGRQEVAWIYRTSELASSAGMPFRHSRIQHQMTGNPTPLPIPMRGYCEPPLKNRLPTNVSLHQDFGRFWEGVTPPETSSKRRGRDSNPRQELPPVTP